MHICRQRYLNQIVNVPCVRTVQAISVDLDKVSIHGLLGFFVNGRSRIVKHDQL